MKRCIVSFVAPSQKADVKKIERLIRKSLPTLSIPTLPPERVKSAQSAQEDQSSYSSRGRSFGGRSTGSRDRNRGRSASKIPSNRGYTRRPSGRSADEKPVVRRGYEGSSPNRRTYQKRDGRTSTARPSTGHSYTKRSTPQGRIKTAPSKGGFASISDGRDHDREASTTNDHKFRSSTRREEPKSYSKNRRPPARAVRNNTRTSKRSGK